MNRKYVTCKTNISISSFKESDEYYDTLTIDKEYEIIFNEISKNNGYVIIADDDIPRYFTSDMFYNEADLRDKKLDSILVK